MQSCDYYFDNYGHYGIHESLLKDTARMRAFKNAIYGNRTLFEDKVVLDAGCGTCIFAMMAANCGAKKVYAVDKSSIIDTARKIVALNRFSDQIEIIKGDLEEVTLPEKVDVIICDYAGCGLLFDSMMSSFIVARDKFLKEGGHIFPSSSRIVMTAIEDEEYRNKKLNFWDNVYGFKYSAMKKEAFYEPLIDNCPSSGVLCGEYIVKVFDSYTVKQEDIDFTAGFNLIPCETNTAHAFIIWFDLLFCGPERSFSFSTSPFCEQTEYNQIVCYLHEPIKLSCGDLVEGKLSMKRNEQNPRNENITFSFTSKGKKYTIDYLLKI